MNKSDKVRVRHQLRRGAEHRAVEARVERLCAQVRAQPTIGAGARVLQLVLLVDARAHLREAAAPVAGLPPEPRAPARTSTSRRQWILDLENS